MMRCVMMGAALWLFSAGCHSGIRVTPYPLEIISDSPRDVRVIIRREGFDTVKVRAQMINGSLFHLDGSPLTAENENAVLTVVR